MLERLVRDAEQIIFLANQSGYGFLQIRQGWNRNGWEAFDLQLWIYRVWEVEEIPEVMPASSDYLEVS